MNTKLLLWSGPIAALLFIFGSLIFGWLLPDYNSLGQTVSEIGQLGSPYEVTWKIFGLTVGALWGWFAIGLWKTAKMHRISLVVPILIATYAIAQLGIAAYPSPNQLHNVFGLLMTVGYCSPLLASLLWKKAYGNGFSRTSLLFAVCVFLGIFLNLSPLFLPNLYPLEYYGLVQRFLLYGFYAYAAYLGCKSIDSLA